jgi:hypothetical protein
VCRGFIGLKQRIALDAQLLDLVTGALEQLRRGRVDGVQAHGLGS